MPRKSKEKERSHLVRVIPKLEAWWGERFAKVPASGALRWGNGFWTYADLAPPVSFPFCVECKFHKEIDLDETIRKPVGQGKITWFWYWQTIADSIRASKDLNTTVYPMLIYRVNAQPDHLVLQEDLFTRIPEEARTFPYFLARVPTATPFAICLLDEFLAAIPRTNFEKWVLGRCETSSPQLS